MDPITGAIAIAGMGMQLFGAASSMSAISQEAGLASQEAQISKDVTGLQIQENEQRRFAMNFISNRKQIQDVRNSQLTAARNLTAGVSQTGGTTSSSVTAGQQGAKSGGLVNLTGEQQQQRTGNQLFDIQNLISGKQISMADIQSQMASLQGTAAIGQGIGALGGSLAGSAGPLGNILGNFFGNASDPTAVLPGGAPLGQGGIGHA